MKTTILTVILVLTLCLTTTATQDCIWTSNKSGLTIRFVAPCDFKNQNLVDSIVNKLVTLLNRQDTSLKIIVYVSNGQLSFPNAEFANFFSIAYDTLREIDDDYIFNHYWNQEGLSTNQNRGLTIFESKRVPLDINSSSDRTTNEVGIKIIYDKDYRLGEPNWEDITKAIVYAAKNVDVIKRQQTRDTVRYNTNGWYVSLMTLDTFSINRILEEKQVTSMTQKKAVATTNKFYFIIAGIGFLAIVSLLFVRRKHSR